MSPRRSSAALILTVVLIGLAGCGSSGSKARHRSQLTVSAAASLKRAFTGYAHRFRAARVRFSFGGSDVLAAQIQQGVRPDIFASANVTLPRQLYAKHLVGKPVVFAANQLVLAVPVGSKKIRSLTDLARPGVTVAIGSLTVPIGAYTRTVLAKLGSAQQKKVMANVRSQEPDVSGIVGKLEQGAVDAGFTYSTDVRASRGKLRAIALPANLQPVVAYGIAVVKGSRHQRLAQRFIAGLLRGRGRRLLLRDGFLPPPRRT